MVGSDLAEGQVEQVVQDERDALGGRERLEHHEQGQAHGARELRFLGRVESVCPGLPWLWCARSERLLAPRRPRPQHVEAHARDDGGQPSAEIVDPRGVGAAEPQPRFLHGVVHLAHRAEHPVAVHVQLPAMWLGQLPERLAVPGPRPRHQLAGRHV